MTLKFAGHARLRNQYGGVDCQPRTRLIFSDVPLPNVIFISGVPMLELYQMFLTFGDQTKEVVIYTLQKI